MMKNAKSKKVFRLFASCIPVKGNQRSTICDLQRNAFKLIPNGMVDLLTEHKNGTLDEIKAAYQNQEDETIEEYFQFLVENEYGFWTDTPELYPEIDTTWKTPKQITNAIIDVNTSSKHDFAKIFKELEILGCEHIEIRIFEHVIPTQLIKILSCSKHNNRLRGIDLLMKYDAVWTDEEILNKLLTPYHQIGRMILHTAPNNKAEANKFKLADLFHINTPIDQHTHCGIISPFFFTANFEQFTESLLYNSCLNRKISIDVDGNIKNCPSMDQSFGNIAHTSLLEVVKNEEFRSVWTIHKDLIEVCKDCEYRHVCSDCRAFVKDKKNKYAKPAKCTYNPYKAKWES